MNLPQDGIKLHRGNFTAIGQQIQPYLEDGKCFRMVLKPWREKRSLSQNARKRLVRTVLIFTESSDQLSRATDRVPGLPASPGYVQ